MVCKLKYMTSQHKYMTVANKGYKGRLMIKVNKKRGYYKLCALLIICNSDTFCERNGTPQKEKKY